MNAPRSWFFVAFLLGVASAAGAQDSFIALSGDEAAGFQVPSDMELVRSIRLSADGLTYERYQQYFGAARAEVLGAQVTLYRDDEGTIRSVLGQHYPSVIPMNSLRRSGAEALATVDRDVGGGLTRLLHLAIDPETGRYQFRVESRGFARRFFHWIDAESGLLLRKINALQSDHGLGVKGDTKDINGPNNSSTADDLTTKSGNRWTLTSKDNRQRTWNARNGTFFIYTVYDSDNHWTAPGRTSPGHPALVDGQFYANVTDDYYQARHGFDWKSCYSQQRSVAHYSVNYNNAFWDGTYLVYGDGDGSATFRELSGGLDVVAHESTHGVTDCFSGLIYQDESGALNESFSDMLGNSAEFFANEPTTTNCRRAAGQGGCADWWIGEDVYLPADSVVGFRNMADPREDDDPDHYSERQIGGGDNGGVHSNSGIPNHAFFLLVNGGMNAGCDAVGSNGHTHAADCDVTVIGIGLSAGERIFFAAFNGLPANATMCQARTATQNQAAALYGAGSQQALSTSAAWEAVGVCSTP